MSDEEQRKLIREFEAGDTAVLPKIQGNNDRLGLGPNDGLYYQHYFKICEDFLNRLIQRDVAETNLSELNEKFQTLVGSKTIRTQILGIHLAAYSGWVPSDVCW